MLRKFTVQSNFTTDGTIRIPRYKPILLPVLVVLVIAAGLLFSAVSYSQDVQSELAGNLLRFHVIANSDSQEDQALKHAVRDAVSESMKELLKNARNIEETKALISANLTEIEEIAADVVHKYGKDYEVKAVLGKYPFPTKVYGDITLPAGEYQALRIIIGKGEGANWWCVLFPPLCFVDATHGTIPDSVKEDLKAALSAEEYDLITRASSEEDIPIRVKFKIVEIIESSRGKIAAAFSGLFTR